MSSEAYPYGLIIESAYKALDARTAARGVGRIVLLSMGQGGIMAEIGNAAIL
jgi:hypothetical protein